jgi:hypothetical protein
MTRTIQSLALLFLTGCGGATVNGKAVDGRTGEPISGFTLKASATSDSASMTCQFFDSEVAEDGSFSFSELCSGTSYVLESLEEDLWLAKDHEIPDGGVEGTFELKVYRAPKGSGLYRIEGDGSMTALKTAADIKQETLKDTEEIVRYPSTVPNNVPLIGADQELLIVGNPAAFKFVPLVRDENERRFANDVKLDPWWFVGVRFESDTKWERLDPEPDAGKVEDLADDKRAARWMSGSALPAGRYAVFRDDDRRMYIMDFGTAWEKPAEE